MSKGKESYRVTYFDARGGGETLRLTLVAAGQEFEDKRVSGDDWPKLKPNCPMKQLPMLTVPIDGKEETFCQSGACARFIAKKYGLFGSNEKEAFFIDEVYESLMDAQKGLIKIMFPADTDTPEAKEKAKENFEKTILPNFNDYFKNRKGKFGSENYIIGKKLSLADIAVFGFLNQLKLIGMGNLLDDYPDLKKHENFVSSDKNISAWISKRPSTKM